MKKYKYVGTEEQLVEKGFNYTGDDVPTIKCYEKDVENREASVCVFLESRMFPIGLMMFSYDSMKFRDIEPYIQDLIDAKLVEVVEE